MEKVNLKKLYSPASSCSSYSTRSTGFENKCFDNNKTITNPCVDVNLLFELQAEIFREQTKGLPSIETNYCIFPEDRFIKFMDIVSKYNDVAYVELNKENMVIIGHNNVNGFIRPVLPISNTDWIETKIINYINIKELVKNLKSFSKEKIRLFVDEQNQTICIFI